MQVCYFEKISQNLSKQHAKANGPGKKFRMGSVPWLTIPFYKLEKFGLATKLCVKQSCDILFWELVYMLRYWVSPASTGHTLASRRLPPPMLDPYPTLTKSIPQLIRLCLLLRMNLYDTTPDKCPFDLHHHHYRHCHHHYRHHHHLTVVWSSSHFYPPIHPSNHTIPTPSSI